MVGGRVQWPQTPMFDTGALNLADAGLGTM